MDRNLKRPLPAGAGDGDDDPKPPMDKRPRFPKGKKMKKDGEAGTSRDDAFGSEWADPLLAAKERAKRRNRAREEELFRDEDLAAGEVDEDVTAFEDYDIQIEPFNLKQEREEGYFDADGNFVEFASTNEIKDAWLDNVNVDPRFAANVQKEVVEDFQDLSSEDVGKTKRRIANLLQPGETIIQALKRLKGSSGDKRGKMNEMTKRMFDQLTEDAMNLMGNGEYDVYQEERETFIREAEGYERLARARDGILESEVTEDLFADDVGHGADQPSILGMPPSTSEANVSSLQVLPSDDGENLDMFGEEDETTDTNLQSGGNGVYSVSTPEQLQTTSVESATSQVLDSGEVADGEAGSDFVYEPSTGYYYSSSLGYYYDPVSQYYCCATSGTWYSYDGNTGAYTEIPSIAPAANNT